MSPVPHFSHSSDSPIHVCLKANQMCNGIGIMPKHVATARFIRLLALPIFESTHESLYSRWHWQLCL